MRKYKIEFPVRMEGKIEVSVNALSEEEAFNYALRSLGMASVIKNFKAGAMFFGKGTLLLKETLPQNSLSYAKIVEESKKSRDGLEFQTSHRGVTYQVTIDKMGNLDSIRTMGDDLSYWHDLSDLTPRERELKDVLPNCTFIYLQEVGE